MKNGLIGWLAGKGVILANDASETEVLKAINKKFDDATAPLTVLANEKDTQGGKISALENEVSTLKSAKTAAETALSNEQTGRKAERKGRAEAVVDLAIQRGKLKPAERDARITALQNSADEAAFGVESKKLLEAAGIVRMRENTESGKALANDMDQKAVRQTYMDAINKHMTENPACDPIAAHNAVMAAHPALSEALKPKAAA